MRLSKAISVVIAAGFLATGVVPASAAEKPVPYDETVQINRWPTTNSVKVFTQFEYIDWTNPVGMCEFVWSKPNTKTASMNKPKCTFKVTTDLPVASGWNNHTVPAKKLIQMINVQASLKSNKFVPIALSLEHFNKTETTMTQSISCSASPKSDSKTNGYAYIYPKYQVTRSTFTQNYESDFKGRRREFRDFYTETKVPASDTYICGASHSKPANTGTPFSPTSSSSKWTGTRLHLTKRELVNYGPSKSFIVSQKGEKGAGSFSKSVKTTTGTALGVSVGWVQAQLMSPKITTDKMNVSCSALTTAARRRITVQTIGLRSTYVIEKRYWDATARKYVRKQETRVKDTPLGVRCKHTNG